MFFQKRTKQDVKSKTPFNFGDKTKKGKDVKYGTVVEFNDGTKVSLLTPAGKGIKYSAELKENIKVTNNGEIKLKNGKPIELTSEERAYRGGYLDSRKDAAKAHNAKKAKKSNNK